MSPTSKVYEIADEYVRKLAALDPITATAIGVAGHDAEMTDFSPVGIDAETKLARDTRAALAKAPVDGERDRVARAVMDERLSVHVALHDANEHFRTLNILASPVQGIRRILDLMPRATEADWKTIASRLKLVPQGLTSYRATLSEGMKRGLLVAKRQATETATQCDVWSGAKGAPPFFDSLLASFDKANVAKPALRAELGQGAKAASTAYADMGKFLRETYAPMASDRDPVGAERYQLHSRTYNGIELDLRETYNWGWEQLAWVDREMAKTARTILSGAKQPVPAVDMAAVEAAKQLLESDPKRSIEGVEAFQKWMQYLQDTTIVALNGKHFDLAPPVKRIEALIAPPGGALAMYYTGPSEDFSRPGRTWYPTGGKTRFPLWGEVSIAYHEGVPGHHFQIATTKFLSDVLSRYQRLLTNTSGYTEGWALYAERLMGELGYLDNPDYYLGMLRAQALRSVRICVDIGMHLELEIPKNQSFHPGEKWTPEIGLEFVKTRSHFPADFVASEISRYLGIPGQAISYKVGERVWLDAREEAKRRLGPKFDLKAWHNRALNLGPMGLSLMKLEMTKAAG